MKILLEEFRTLPDYRKGVQEKGSGDNDNPLKTSPSCNSTIP